MEEHAQYQLVALGSERLNRQAEDGWRVVPGILYVKFSQQEPHVLMEKIWPAKLSPLEEDLERQSGGRKNSVEAEVEKALRNITAIESLIPFVANDDSQENRSRLVRLNGLLDELRAHVQALEGI